MCTLMSDERKLLSCDKSQHLQVKQKSVMIIIILSAMT